MKHIKLCRRFPFQSIKTFIKMPFFCCKLKFIDNFNGLIFHSFSSRLFFSSHFVFCVVLCENQRFSQLENIFCLGRREHLSRRVGKHEHRMKISIDNYNDRADVHNYLGLLEWNLTISFSVDRAFNLGL